MKADVMALQEENKTLKDKVGILLMIRIIMALSLFSTLHLNIDKWNNDNALSKDGGKH